MPASCTAPRSRKEKSATDVSAVLAIIFDRIVNVGVSIGGEKMAELNSIESHMEKVVQYLEELAKSDKKLYAKTRTRLGGLNSQLCHSVELISQILTDNILKQDTEFGENIGDLKREVDSLNKDMSSVMTQVTQLNSFIDSSKNLSIKRKILLTYKEVLHETASKNIELNHIKTCSTLIDNWFTCRFYLSLNHDAGFKYKIEMIPQWILDIIILYGYCISTGDFSDIEQFSLWCKNVGSGIVKTNYAVPYCVHRMSRSFTRDYVTFSGLGIYDLLLDAGYDKLNSNELNGVVLSPYMLQDKFRAYCPEIVDGYTYCGDDESLLRKYKLIGG